MWKVWVMVYCTAELRTSALFRDESIRDIDLFCWDIPDMDISHTIQPIRDT